MSEIPVCFRCKKPHYNFTRCEDAQPYVAPKPEPPLGSVLRSVPDGYRLSGGWGAGDAWGSRGPQEAA